MNSVCMESADSGEYEQPNGMTQIVDVDAFIENATPTLSSSPAVIYTPPPSPPMVVYVSNNGTTTTGYNNNNDQEVSLAGGPTSAQNTVSTISFGGGGSHAHPSPSTTRSYLYYQNHRRHQDVDQDSIVLPPPTLARRTLIGSGILSFVLILALTFSVTFLLSRDANNDESSNYNPSPPQQQQQPPPLPPPQASVPPKPDPTAENPTTAVTTTKTMTLVPTPSPSAAPTTRAPFVLVANNQGGVTRITTPPSQSPERSTPTSFQAVTWGRSWTCQEDASFNLTLQCGGDGVLNIEGTEKTSCSSETDGDGATIASCRLEDDQNTGLVLFSCTSSTPEGRTATANLPEIQVGECSKNNLGRTRSLLLRRDLLSVKASSFVGVSRFCQDDQQGWKVWSQFYGCHKGERMLLTQDGDVWEGDPPVAGSMDSTIFDALWSHTNFQSFCFRQDSCECDHGDDSCECDLEIGAVQMSTEDPREECYGLDRPEYDDMLIMAQDILEPSNLLEKLNEGI